MAELWIPDQAADTLRENGGSGDRWLSETAADMVAQLQERLIELELALDVEGWVRLDGSTDVEFSRDALAQIIRLARIAYLKNPLINHAVEVQKHYVWAQGVSVQGRNPAVNTVVQTFLDDPDNEGVLDEQSRPLLEVELQVSGNLYFPLFANPVTGTVRVRTIPAEQITDIIRNPDDADEPWYYVRSWAQQPFDPVTGQGVSTTTKAYYPDWRYRPKTRPPVIADVPVKWDAPVYHRKVGSFRGWRFGIPEVYPALDWAKAVKDDLEDYATIRRALAKFAWRLTTPGGKRGVTSAKTRLATSVTTSSPLEQNPTPLPGSTFIGADGIGMEPIRTAGMAPSPDEGRRLWLMAGAGVGLPETMLSGDVAKGAHATAQTLDRPTELKMRERQTLWQGILKDLCSYAVEQAVRAGTLKGTVVETGRASRITLAVDPDTSEPADPTVDVVFPDILERDIAARVAAIVNAATLGGNVDAGLIPAEQTLRMLLLALNVDDVDELVDQVMADQATDTQAESTLVEACRLLRAELETIREGRVTAGR